MSTSNAQTHEERSIPQLLGDAMHQTATLVRQEVALAKAELGDKLAALRTAGIGIAAGAALAFAGLMVLLGSLTLGLDLWLQKPWLSALVVGAGAVAVGGGMIAAAMSTLEPEPIKPERTLRSLQHDTELAAEHLS